MYAAAVEEELLGSLLDVFIRFIIKQAAVNVLPTIITYIYIQYYTYIAAAKRYREIIVYI